MLISEFLEKVLEMKLLSKEEDFISSDGKFMHSETVVNEYTPKAMNIKSQSINTQIKNMSDEKILQENSADIKFKTDRHGNISEQVATMKYGMETVTSDPVRYTNKYNGSNLIYSMVEGTVHSPKDGSAVACINRTAYQYDEVGRIKLVINDCIPAENGAAKISNMNFVQTYVLEYNDEGMVEAVNLTDIDTYNNDYKFYRFVFNYAPNGYIENIHREGTDKREDEYFQYFDDSTVTVAKNKYSEDGTVIGKTVLNFKVA